MADRNLGLAPGASYTQEWAIYPTSDTCPDYYCEMVEKAGGEIIDLSGIGDPAAWGGITNFTRFYEVAATADVWLYPGNNWDSTSMDAGALVSVRLRSVPSIPTAGSYS